MWGSLSSQNIQGVDPPRRGLRQRRVQEESQDVAGRVDVHLTRWSLQEPWGFNVERLPGSEAIVVQRVFGGSIADSQQLARGDVITAVNGSDVAYLTYAETLELITQAGNDLTLTIQSQSQKQQAISQEQYRRQTSSNQQPTTWRQPLQRQQEQEQQQQLLLQQQQQLLQQQQNLQQQYEQPLYEQQYEQQTYQQQLLQQQQQQLYQPNDYQPLRYDQTAGQESAAEQPLYDTPERPSRPRALLNRSDLAEPQDGIRSSSAGPLNRSRPTTRWNPPPPSNLMEMGWAPRSKTISSTSRSVSQSDLAKPSWSSRPRPQPKPKTPEYPSMTEMGWCPKPKGGQTHASNPALNEMGWAPKVKPKPLSVSTTNVNSLPVQNDRFEEDEESFGTYPESNPCNQQQNLENEPSEQPTNHDPNFGAMPGWFNALRSGVNRQSSLDKKVSSSQPVVRNNEFGWTPKSLSSGPRMVQPLQAQSSQSAFKQKANTLPRNQQFGQTFENEPHWTSYPKKLSRNQIQDGAGEERFVSEIQNIKLSTSGLASNQPQPVQRSQQVAAAAAVPQQQVPQHQQLLQQVPQPHLLHQKQVQQQQLQQKIRSPGMAPAIQVPYVPTQITGQSQQPRFPLQGQQPRQIGLSQIQPVQTRAQSPHMQQIRQGDIGGIAHQQLEQSKTMPQAPPQFISRAGQQYRQPLPDGSVPIQQPVGIMPTQQPAVYQQQVSSELQQPKAAAVFSAPQSADVPKAVIQTVPAAEYQLKAIHHASRPVANAFTDFYVIEPSAAAELPTGQATNICPAIGPTQSSDGSRSIEAPSRKLYGGFVDFYVISDISVEKSEGLVPNAQPTRSVSTKDGQQSNATAPSSIPSSSSTVSGSAIISALTKTVSGGFIDFYVLSEGSGASVTPAVHNIPQITQQSCGKTQSGGFVDFYVLPQGTSTLQQNSTPVQPKIQSQTGRTYSGGFVDFYVLPEGNSKKVTSSLGHNESSVAEKTQSGGFVDFYVLLQNATKTPGNKIVPSQQKVESLAEPDPKQVQFLTGKTSQAEPVKLAPGNLESGKITDPKSQLAAAAAVDLKPVGAQQEQKGGQKVPHISQNGKANAGEVKQLVLEKAGPAINQSGAGNIQKPSTPAAVRDQLKSTKAPPGKLK